MLFAYYQIVMYYSAYRGYRSNAMFKCDVSERRRGRNAGKKAAECCRIFGFDSQSRQFIFNALHLGSNSYIRLESTVMHYEFSKCVLFFPNPKFYYNKFKRGHQIIHRNISPKQ